MRKRPLLTSTATTGNIEQKSHGAKPGHAIKQLREEVTTPMLAEFDAETRFNVCAARGASRDERGLELRQKAL